MLSEYHLIIEDNAGYLFAVQDAEGPNWVGIPVKRVKGGFAPKASAKPRLVRKAFTRILASI